MTTDRRYDAKRRAEKPWRKWYNTARWKLLRLRVFLRDVYRCKMCGEPTVEPVADHITPHHGIAALFWDENNIQTLCTTCHDIHKQRLERGFAPRVAIGEDGWPISS